MIIERLAVVGVGLIGGSIALAAKKRGIAAHVIGVETNAGSWADALRVGAADEITNDLVVGLKGADLVILAVPVGVILSLLPRLQPLIGRRTVVTDTGSVKSDIAEAGFAALGSQFVPGHPMAGSEKDGVLHARADLFHGATWAVTVTDHSQVENAAHVAEFAKAIGANPYALSPKAHDETVAITSHLPHVIAYTLVAMGRQSGSNVDRLAAGSWASATRVAKSPPSLWTDISMQNAVPLAAVLRQFAEDISNIAMSLENAERDTIHKTFAAGHSETGKSVP